MTGRRTDPARPQSAAASSERRTTRRTASVPADGARDDGEPAPHVRTYVVDTSVLLSDPAAFHRFAEHDVVLPLVVISELEGKRHHPELGWFARRALRLLDDLRVKHGRLDHRCRPTTWAARCAWS